MTTSTSYGKKYLSGIAKTQSKVLTLPASGAIFKILKYQGRIYNVQ